MVTEGSIFSKSTLSSAPWFFFQWWESLVQLNSLNLWYSHSKHHTLNTVYYIWPWHISSGLQIRTSQWSITANLCPFTAHIYHVMIIVTGGFSKKSFFFINIIFIFLKFFWPILNLFSWNLNTFTKYKEQVLMEPKFS